MAPRTGYGDALCRTLAPKIACTNLARGGRSSKSYRAEGLWDGVMQTLRDREAARATHVLIQFGHNDQPGKAERTTDLATEFPANIARYVDEVKAAGAMPVLVTPLTRRSFRDHVLHNDLVPWADATRRVAQARGVPLLELNADSAAAVQRMGPAEADVLAMAPPDFDRTHLGPRGARFFAHMVAKELGDAVPALSVLRTVRPQLSDAQARDHSYGEVLKHTGAVGQERVDPWDPLSEPPATGAAPKPDYTVDAAAKADGNAVFHTVQSAVSAAVARAAAEDRKARIHILVKPGTYRELLYVPEGSPPITIFGGSSDASATRISATLDATMTGSQYAATFGGQFAGADPRIAAMFASLKERAAVGTPGSAVTWIRNSGFQAKDITFENAHNKDRGDSSAKREGVLQTQAVALMVDGADRVQFENVRFIGFQDTLFLQSGAPGRIVRAFVNKSYIEGDMDFIFGDATAYFRQTEIRTLGERFESFTLAPSTHARNRYGFVFNDCRFTHDGTPNALAGTFKLARQWFRGQRCTPYGRVTVPAGYRCTFGADDTYEAPTGTISKAPLEAVGKVAILHSRIGAHLDRAQPWAEWNAAGARSHRPVQYDSDDYWANLVAAGIDPVRDLGLAARKVPAEPFLAEYRNTNE
jgi:pectin methylesterase-like acyl-CoA thioesterase/lysophospholipase L1-like esterase